MTFKIKRTILKTAVCAAVLASQMATAGVTDNTNINVTGEIVARTTVSSCSFDTASIDIDLGSWDRETGTNSFAGKAFPITTEVTCNSGVNGFAARVAPTDYDVTLNFDTAGTARVYLYDDYANSTCLGSYWYPPNAITMGIPPSSVGVKREHVACIRIQSVSDDAEGTLNAQIPLTIGFE